ncbi:MAG: hypothetical protein Q8O68_00470 [Candidatus Daviesbacteria bacterium]|nr:hypothetical protein [Candidatus Daviesbacteria bacterium]
MALEITRIIASKHDGEEGVQSQISNVSANSNSTITYTIPQNHVFYLTEYGGNVPASDIVITVRNRNNQSLVSFTEFPDFFHMFEYLPFLKEAFKNNVNILVENNTGTSQAVTIIIKGILIPERNQVQFEKEVKDMVFVPSILRGDC